jgi:hypothetical protein
MPPKQPPLGGPGQQPPRYAAPGQPLNAQMLGAGGNLNVNIMSNAKQVRLRFQNLYLLKFALRIAFHFFFQTKRVPLNTTLINQCG